MPHVILNGPASVEQYYLAFEPLNIRKDGRIMKAKDAFICVDRTKVLLECVVVEDRVSQMFYIALSHKAGKISVHLDPLTDPERNDAVKRLLAIVAHQLKSQNSTCRYESHNLAGFLVE